MSATKSKVPDVLPLPPVPEHGKTYPFATIVIACCMLIGAVLAAGTITAFVRRALEDRDRGIAAETLRATTAKFKTDYERQMTSMQEDAAVHADERWHKLLLEGGYAEFDRKTGVWKMRDHGDISADYIKSQAEMPVLMPMPMFKTPAPVATPSPVKRRHTR